MRLEEISLDERDEKMLNEILSIYNKGLSPQLQKSKKEYIEDLLKEAIYFKWKMLKAG